MLFRRANNVYEAPRDDSKLDAELVEMKRSRANGCVELEVLKCLKMQNQETKK
jgi:hypothetical protein